MPKETHIDEKGLRDLYQRLMDINRKAFAGQEYDIAYHVLAAALHCGQSLKDTQYLGEVEKVAQEELVWIDAHHPEYEHSTQSASKRNHASVYQILAQQAKARITIIRNAAKTFPPTRKR